MGINVYYVFHQDVIFQCAGIQLKRQLLQIATCSAYLKNYKVGKVLKESQSESNKNIELS